MTDAGEQKENTVWMPTAIPLRISQNFWGELVPCPVEMEGIADSIETCASPGVPPYVGVLNLVALGEIMWA